MAPPKVASYAPLRLRPQIVTAESVTDSGRQSCPAPASEPAPAPALTPVPAPALAPSHAPALAQETKACRPLHAWLQPSRLSGRSH
eukprot:3188924-Rhodomonas_salina.1